MHSYTFQLPNPNLELAIIEFELIKSVCLGAMSSNGCRVPRVTRYQRRWLPTCLAVSIVYRWKQSLNTVLTRIRVLYNCINTICVLPVAYIWHCLQCRINPSGGPMPTRNGGPSNPLVVRYCGDKPTYLSITHPLTHPMTSPLTSSEIPITQPPTLTSSWTLEG